MIHPLFRLAAARPQLLAEHVSAYSELLAEELTVAAAVLKRRVLLQLVGLVCFAVAVVLSGVAVMLWAVMPIASLRAPWPLILVPALPAALGLVAILVGSAGGPGELFASLRRQLAADAAVLRSVGDA